MCPSAENAHFRRFKVKVDLMLVPRRIHKGKATRIELSLIHDLVSFDRFICVYVA